MTRLLLCPIIFISTFSFGQNLNEIETRVTRFQDSLKENNIDTFFKYSLVCSGSVNITDTCNVFNDCYLLWKQKGNTFLQKFDGCKLYKPLLLDTINPLTFYITHRKKIDGEIIYSPTYIQSKHGETVTTISQTIDHTCFYEMTFFIKKRKVCKRASDFDLSFKEFDNGRKNMYFNYNSQTQLKKLIEQITQFVKQLHTDKLFEVQ
ncbi:MAG: hypothetical protein JWR61_4207 [Ferruginibacter sp.]|uniref:hypothetical protein n=1 Tax=Ferruginibacter sp. TaxID=1940288 RepID=UPI00265842C5|nr:hypothetical protein [Ferruginibacter sp.]MDB5279252.1 hypothetical protein [Ferruginibacter sp.]